MELPTYIKEVRQQLLADEISWREALECLQEATKKKKPWQYKEWRQERAILIKDSCLQCGISAESVPMVLQHLWQPRKLAIIFDQLTTAKIAANADLRNQYIDSLKKNSKKLNNIVIGDRECCPKCESTSIKFLKGSQAWKCSGTKSCKTITGYNRKVTCGNLFKEPAVRKELTPEQKREISKIKQDIWSKACVKFDEKSIRESHGKQAILESIQDSERYYSLKDTTTFCKKCAYLMDIKKLLLCPNCNDFLPISHVLICSPIMFIH
ncbi:hypothetical protein [Psychrobacter urativorans]|uniref:hypothetical protein n=1 Tax=Psychrobacter urativorans TaxID=45610 RepID=UPI0019183011|nr:hypothetical protein [Psychrobacter urativorans]